MRIESTMEAIGEELIAIAEAGGRFAFTTSDNVGRDSAMGRLMQTYPERCFDFGIAEQDQVGASAGLALVGQPVFAKVFGPFLPLRAADQIHADIAYNDVPVRLIGDHLGITAAGGPTHNVICDLALMRAIPNLTVVSPADARETRKLIHASMAHEGPIYMRMTKGNDPVVYDEDYTFAFGKAVTLTEGTDLTLIACSTAVYWSLQAADMLAKKGIHARVINLHSIKPFDSETVRKAARETGCILTVEEHSIHGGLGGAVAELIAEEGLPARLERIGFPDEFLILGPPPEVYRHYRMDPESIAARAEALLRKQQA